MGPVGFILFIVAILMLVDIKWKQDKMLAKMDQNNELLANILDALNNEAKQEEKETME